MRIILLKATTLTLVSLIFFTHCEDNNKPEPPAPKPVANAELTISLNDLAGNEIYEQDTVALTNGYNYHLTLFSLYITQVKAITTDDKEVLLKDVLLFSSRENAGKTYQMDIPEGSYKAIELGYGVDPVQNDADPTSFQNAHPLSTYQGMYWSMLKYRFAKLEGTAISSSDTVSTTYHPGTNPIYQTVTYPASFTVTSDGVTINLHLDFDIFFNGPAGSFDFPNEHMTHADETTIIIAAKLMENIAASGSVEITP